MKSFEASKLAEVQKAEKDNLLLKNMLDKLGSSTEKIEKLTIPKPLGSIITDLENDYGITKSTTLGDVFEIKDRKSGERIINNPNKDNEKQLVYVKPKKAITFRAAKKFDISVNENDFKLVSDAKIKKLGRDYRKKLATSKNGNRFKNVVDLLKIANKRKEV